MYARLILKTSLAVSCRFIVRFRQTYFSPAPTQDRTLPFLEMAFLPVLIVGRGSMDFYVNR
jgi:hypothetical protein